MMKTNKGLIVNVLRDAKGGDCTNSGASSKFTEFVIVDPEIAEIFEPTATMPALKLVRRSFGNKLYIHAEPLTSVPANCVGFMFGGNFVYSCDSRFRSVCEYPIPVHDRIETARNYELLSL